MRGPRWWRTSRGNVLWPLAVGLVFCALSLGSFLAYQHHQAAFRAQAVPAKAVIDEIYVGAPSQNYDAPTFGQYAVVHFEAQGQIAHARVLLANCRGVCPPTYRVGQVLAVDYSPGNLSYAQLPSRTQGNWGAILDTVFTFGLIAAIFLFAAAFNMATV